MKTTDAFSNALSLLRCLYEAEIERLSGEYRARILAGEFSTTNDDEGPNFLRLERELAASHPWLADQRGRLVAEACSRWLADKEKALTHPRTGERLGEGVEYDPGDMAAECMAHDVLAVAASRGWVRRMRYLNDRDLYALRVA